MGNTVRMVISVRIMASWPSKNVCAVFYNRQQNAVVCSRNRNSKVFPGGTHCSTCVVAAWKLCLQNRHTHNRHWSHHTNSVFCCAMPTSWHTYTLLLNWQVLWGSFSPCLKAMRQSPATIRGKIVKQAAHRSSGSGCRITIVSGAFGALRSSLGNETSWWLFPIKLRNTEATPLKRLGKSLLYFCIQNFFS